MFSTEGAPATRAGEGDEEEDAEAREGAGETRSMMRSHLGQRKNASPVSASCSDRFTYASNSSAGSTRCAHQIYAKHGLSCTRSYKHMIRSIRHGTIP